MLKKRAKKIIFLIGLGLVCWENHGLSEKSRGTGRVLFSFPKEDYRFPYVVLTLDDGPGPQTLKILEILKKHNIKAIFFVLGERAKRYPAILKKIQEEGHVLSNHGFDHKSFPKLTSHQQNQQLKETNIHIRKYQSVVPFFRPPYGAINDSVKKNVSSLGMDILLWDVDSEDWRRKMSKQTVLNNVFSQLHSGSIILVHDIHKRTADLMEELIQGILKRGYRIVLPACIDHPQPVHEAVSDNR